MSDVKQPEYLEDARGYELVAQIINRMLSNGGFDDESKRTIRKLKSICKQMEGGIVRSNEKAHTEKPVKTVKKSISTKNDMPTYQPDHSVKKRPRRRG